jgi:hypothetical protein
VVEPVLPGARGPRATRKEGAPDPAAGANDATAPAASSAPAPLFGASATGIAKARAAATSPGAVISEADALPPELERQLAGREDGPRLAALVTTLFPVIKGSEDRFGAEALESARAVQERAAALTAEIAQRDLNGRLARLTETLMGHAAPGFMERARRALGGKAAGLDVAAIEQEMAALQRELKIVLPPAEGLARQAAPSLADLESCAAALNLARPWLDTGAVDRRVRLLEAARAGCSLVPAQAKQLVEQLREHAERLQTLESATLPSLRNVEATRELGRK